MTPKRFVWFAGVNLIVMVIIPAVGLAHHDLSKQFDTSKSITLAGDVEKVDWSNPHVRLYLDVRGSGNTVTWEVEMGPPNLQLMKGWKIDTYKHGDHVMIDAYPARDGANVAYGKTITAVAGGLNKAIKPSPSAGH